MSLENVEVVKRAIAAVNDRDIDRYLAACTEDIELRTPLAAIGGVYEGPDDIRRFFADIQDTSPDFRLDLKSVEAIGADRVLAFLQTTASGRASGIPTGAGLRGRGEASGVETETPFGYVVEYENGKATRVRAYLDPKEALEAVGLSD